LYWLREAIRRIRKDRVCVARHVPTLERTAFTTESLHADVHQACNDDQ